MKTTNKSSFSTAAILMLAVMLAVFTPSFANAAKTHITLVSRLAAPPAGKALVNIHRLGPKGPWGSDDFRIPIFDETGKFLMDLPNKTECQLIFEPGTKTLITWFGANPVAVVTADLAQNKTYDFVFDVSIWKGGTYLVPLSQAPHGLQNLEKLEEKMAKKVYVLERDEAALAYEASQQAHIEQIKADFLGGKKSARLVHVNQNDCR